MHQRVPGSIAGQGTYLGWGLIPGCGAYRRQPIDVSLSHRCFSLSPFLSLKSINISSQRKKRKKKRREDIFIEFLLCDFVPHNTIMRWALSSPFYKEGNWLQGLGNFPMKPQRAVVVLVNGAQVQLFCSSRHLPSARCRLGLCILAMHR